MTKTGKEKLNGLKFVAVLLCLLVNNIVYSANNPIDSLETLLRNHPQIQEKVYVHTDNTCYFLGDTLWYKAYVVRADDMKPTNMSKILYVELLTPDGYLVERQQVKVSDKGETCGQFALQDSLYSGYYELRAYTKWQLNFNVSIKPHGIKNYRIFYTESMENDFFRDYEGLYSRVFPIYERPDVAGDYRDRQMVARPLQRNYSEESIPHIKFYPEGGRLVRGVENHIAYEIADDEGRQYPYTCMLSDGRSVSTLHGGRGVFTVVPDAQPLTMSFMWNGKEMKFRLPESTEDAGTLHYDAHAMRLSVTHRGAEGCAVAMLCRGRLQHFIKLPKGEGTIDVRQLHLPTGVNEILLYDAEAEVAACRQIFVDNHDCGRTLNINMREKQPDADCSFKMTAYEKGTLEIKGNEGLSTVSVSVREAQDDEPSYYDGTILTDMLLSSDLKGFVEHPAYYFESEDDEHVRNLDVLMMVQGWRKYTRVKEFRYEPEFTQTYVGQVLEVPEEAEPYDVNEMNSALTGLSSSNGPLFGATTNYGTLSMDYGKYGRNMSWHDVIAEMEISKDGECAGATVPVDAQGRFTVQIPPFYDTAILFVTAYNRVDSAKYCLTSRRDKHAGQESEYPNYYIKREAFFPRFTKPYSWYQVNEPDPLVDVDSPAAMGDDINGMHYLGNVTVKSKRRSKRRIDFTKPAYVDDVYKLYNDVTDSGLSYGVYDPAVFPLQLATYLFGYMGQDVPYKVRGMIDKTTYFRNYSSLWSGEMDEPMTRYDLVRALQLKRLMNARVYTDYDMRTGKRFSYDGRPAVTISFEPIPDDGKRYTYRDRRYVLSGFNYAEEFYSPDYSHSVPTAPTDYRRTLYWNPNAKLTEDGTFTATFYGNSRECRVKVSAAGVGADGQLYYTE